MIHEIISAQEKYCQERGLPCFIQDICFGCGRSIDKLVTLKEAETRHITSCPHCRKAWDD